MNQLPKYIEDFSKTLKLKGKQQSTVDSYCRDVKNFFTFTDKYSLSLGSVTPQTLVDFQEFLQLDCNEKENSIRRAVIGVKQFFKFLESEKIIISSPLEMVVIPPRNEELPEALKESEFEQLLKVAQKSSSKIKATRDAAILALLAYEGLKATEAIALTWDDYLNESGRGSIKLPGSRSRVITLHPITTELIQTYKRIFNNLKMNTLRPNMFIAFKGREAAKISPQITRHGLKFMLYELGEKIQRSALNTELLRHHAINYMICEGKTPEEIMQHLGLKRLGNIAKHFAKDEIEKSRSAQIQGSVS